MKWYWMWLGFIIGLIVSCTITITIINDAEGIKPTIQEKIVEIAIKEIGKGETIGDDRGPDIDRYFKGTGIKNKPWCAAFVNWVLKQEGINEFESLYSAKTILNTAKNLEWITKNPKTGDLICFWRVSKKSWRGHIGIIEKITEIVYQTRLPATKHYIPEIITYIHTIEGNVGEFPSKVKRFKYRTDKIKKLLGYIRIRETKKKVVREKKYGK